MAQEFKEIDQILFTSKLGVIPEQFHRTFEERPFENCDLCHRSLLEDDTEYTINKYFARGELRQELVICSTCQDDLSSHYSADSMSHVDGMLARVDLEERQRLISRPGAVRLSEMISHCVICDTFRDDVDDYFMYAECMEDKLIFSFHPSIVCGHCAAELYKGFSEETREARRRFFEPHFGLPPMPGRDIESESQRNIDFLA